MHTTPALLAAAMREQWEEISGYAPEILPVPTLPVPTLALEEQCALWLTHAMVATPISDGYTAQWATATPTPEGIVVWEPENPNPRTIPWQPTMRETAEAIAFHWWGPCK